MMQTESSTDAMEMHTKMWLVIGVGLFAILTAVGYRPSTSAAGIATGVLVPIAAAASGAVLVAESRWPDSRWVHLVAFVAIGAFGGLVFLDEVWTILSFVMYAVAYSRGPRAGIVWAGVVSAVWSASWVFNETPLVAIIIPVLVFVVSAMLSTTIYRIDEANSSQAGLISELEASRRELADAEHRKGTLEERARVAGEIHDTLAQGFTSIVLLSRAAQRAGDTSAAFVAIEETALENLEAARRLVEASGPAELADASLLHALERETCAHTTWFERCEFRVDGEPRSLSAESEAVLLRGTQEALTNIRAHADASVVTVSLSYLDDAVFVDVSDDGVGFEPGAVADRGALTGGQGLRSLEQRIELLGGQMIVETAPGTGCVVSMRLDEAAS